MKTSYLISFLPYFRPSFFSSSLVSVKVLPKLTWLLLLILFSSFGVLAGGGGVTPSFGFDREPKKNQLFEVRRDGFNFSTSVRGNRSLKKIFAQAMAETVAQLKYLSPSRTTRFGLLRMDFGSFE